MARTHPEPFRSGDAESDARGRGRAVAWIALAALAALALAIVLYGILRGPGLIAHAIERIGSQVTDTPVRVGEVDVALSGPGVDLAAFSVGNPDGFSQSQPALRFGAIDVEVGHVLGDGPIVLETLDVGAPVVRVEIQDGARVNVMVLRDQIRASARAGRPGPPPAELGDVIADRASRAHIRVERLAIDPARVEVDVSELGPDEPIELSLGAIELTDVGGSDGATPAELTRTITLAILESTLTELTDADVPGLREGVPGLLDRIQSAGQELLDGI
jgi:hypothetical protein